ncbi:hypothetical protein TrispH2_010121 [Trichoplax sp. H2]|nr:hypothetical protein TrispH2_010121 [Trichoplax sp. H2]|eukprot:RDD39070.1 hypothetical protein TrispH2_010121 [Trichoplax sp. H2]
MNVISFNQFQFAQADNLTGNTFIGSYTWLSSPRIQEIDYRIFGAVIGIAFSSRSLEGFRDYLDRLNFCNNLDNPRFMQLWRQKLSELDLNADMITANCTLDSSLKTQFSNKFYSPIYEAVFVMDAVIAFGHALHKALGYNPTHCPSLITNKLNKNKFNAILCHIRFKGVSSQADGFDSKGNLVHFYSMY